MDHTHFDGNSEYEIRVWYDHCQNNARQMLNDVIVIDSMGYVRKCPQIIGTESNRIDILKLQHLHRVPLNLVDIHR